MNKKIDIHRGDNSCAPVGSLSNNGFPVVICLILLLIVLLLLAAGGVHAEPDQVATGETNPAVIEVTPAQTPVEEVPVEREVESPVLSEEPPSPPFEEVPIEREVGPPVLLEEPFSPPVEEVPIERGVEPPVLSEEPLSPPVEEVPIAIEVTPTISEDTPTSTPAEEMPIDISSEPPVIIAPEETPFETIEPTPVPTTTEVTVEPTEVPTTQPTTAAPTVVTTVPTPVPTTANVTAEPTVVPEVTVSPTTLPVVDNPGVNATPEIQAPIVNPGGQPLVAPPGNFTGTIAPENNVTILSPEPLSGNTTSGLVDTASLTPGINATTASPTSPSGSNYTWSDPPLNTTLDNPYYLIDNQSWVINEPGHNWVMDLNQSNTTGRGITLTDNIFSGFGSQFGILINASNVIFDGMGAILDGRVNNTQYGIMVNNQNASSYNTFSSDPLAGISIRNITLINFQIAGIFFNNVIGPGLLSTPSNITGVQVNSSGNGIVLQNSQGIDVISNNFTDNHENGIVLDGSNGNTLANNNASINTLNGIVLTNSSSNIVFSNTASGNTLSGIVLNSSSTQNNLTGNNVNNNRQNGIVLDSVGFNNLTENIVGVNQDGIVLLNAWNSTLTGNNASYNLQSGINLTSSYKTIAMI